MKLLPTLRQAYGAGLVALGKRRQASGLKLGRREEDGKRIADAVHVFFEGDVGVVQSSDFAHDGESEPAAVGVRAEQPMESLENAFAFFDRNSRTVVTDRKLRLLARNH